MQPMKMQPVLVERVWGGRRLAELLGKPVPEGVKIGESWELSDHPHGRTRVADGPLAGRTLREVLERHGQAVLGRNGQARAWSTRFGILVKFIDAADCLSVQVHPDDAHAARHSQADTGKTECWVVVHAEPGAWAIDGLRPGTTRDRLAAALKKGTIEELLTTRSVKAGDFIWVPAGTVHAIGPGVVLAEVQQTSDLTYRLYDWNRTGADGKPRALHVDRAMECIRFTGDAPGPGGRGRTADETGLVIENLVDGPAFSLSRIRIDRRPYAVEMGGACAALIVVAGSARLAVGDVAMPIRAGDTVLVPADCEEYALETPDRLTVLVAAPSGKAPQR
jgi:mannose-6-phosphate isomerase